MNQVHIHFQGKEDPKNILSTKEKAKDFPHGLTVVFMEEATQGKQIGVELIMRGDDIFGRETINAATVTENNFDGILGAFVAARIRWGKMPVGQFEMVQTHVREQFDLFIEYLIEKYRIDDMDEIKQDIQDFLNRK